MLWVSISNASSHAGNIWILFNDLTNFTLATISVTVVTVLESLNALEHLWQQLRDCGMCSPAHLLDLVVQARATISERVAFREQEAQQARCPKRKLPNYLV